MKNLFTLFFAVWGVLFSYGRSSDLPFSARSCAVLGSVEFSNTVFPAETHRCVAELSEGSAWLREAFPALGQSPVAGVLSAVKGSTGEEVSAGPRFAVMSDVHLGGSGSTEKVPRAFRNLIKPEPDLDAIFICGDLTDYGLENQYEQLAEILNDRSVVPEHIPVYLMMGNHDNYGDQSAELYKRLGQPLHQYITIKGYPFITISTRGTANSGTSNHDEEAYAFLEEKLAEAARDFPGKPIFVFDHYPAANTVYGSDNWGNPRLYEIMKPYPQVIAFSGHSHFPLSDPRSIYQKDFTSINDGNISYSEVNPGEVSEGIHPAGYDEVNEAVIVKVDEDSNVEVVRWNTANDQGIEPNWNILAPHDGQHFLYANRTGGEKPFFEDEVSVKVSDVTTDQCKVTFGQAKDDENVHHYLIEIVQDNMVVASNKVFSGFYLLDRMPAELSVVLKGIPSNVVLKARVTAFDSFDNASEPLYSNPFSTKEYQPAPGTSRPEADLLDVEFGKDGAAVDVSSKHTVVGLGQQQPSTYFDELYNMQGATFSGDTKTYYKIDYSQDEVIKEALQNHFTMELLCKPNSTDGMCPFSGQESGGFGIEQTSGGIINFYAHIGGGYKILKSSSAIEAGKYYHIVATYDKAESVIRLFVNGNPVDEMEVSGEVRLPNEVAQWIGIGADAKDNTTGQFAFDGDILVARLYGKAVSRDEVYWMYKYVNDKKENGYEPAPGTRRPEADLFDLAFHTDGTVADTSGRSVTVLYGAERPAIAKSLSFELNEATFTGSSKCFYRIDYAADEAIKDAFRNAFTYEVLYCPDNSKNVCPLSAQESGGAGIEQDGNGTIQLYVHLGGGYQVLKSNVQVVPGNYYHVVASYDKAEGLLKMYVNGLYAGSRSVSGDFGFPSAEDAQWIAVGGDSHGGNYSQYCLQGKVALARMYGKAVDRDEVYWMYKAVEEKKVSTDYEPDYDVPRPVADLLDVAWSEDGTVEDASAAHLPVVKGSQAPLVRNNEGYGRKEAVFSGSNQCYYGIDYSENETLRNAFRNGFAFEVLYASNQTNNVCPMSTQQYGGCGIEQLSGGMIGFYLNLTSGTVLLKSNVVIVPGRYYHVVGTYDREAGEARLFVDGKLCAVAPAEGDYKFSSTEGAQWIAIGGDSYSEGIDGGAQFSLDGSMLVARMYGKSLSLDEVYWLYAALEGEKAVAQVRRALSKQGVGYPRSDAASRAELTAALEQHAASRSSLDDNEALLQAVDLYKKADAEIQLPESGKAYRLVSVGKYGTLYYLSQTDEGSCWQEDEALATRFVCRTLENGTLALVSDAGRYFTWFGDAGGYNENKGYVEAYADEACAVVVKKLTAGEGVSPFVDTDLFGLVALDGGTAKGAERKYLTVGAGGEPGAADGPVLNDEWSSGLLMEEVEYANRVVPEQVEGIDDVKFLTTFSAPFATLVPAGARAYVAKAAEAGLSEVEMEVLAEGAAIPANAGVVVAAEAAGELVFVPATDETPAAVEGNLLGHSAGADRTLEPGDAYVLSTREGLSAFYAVESEELLPMNRAFLSVSGAGGVVRMNFGGTSSGIDSPELTAGPDADIYDLSGRKVKKMVKKGIYIRNRQKIYVR